MTSRLASVVPMLVLIAGTSTTLAAESLDSTPSPSGPQPGTNPLPSPNGQSPQVLGNGNQSEVAPGAAQGAGRVVYLQGLVDLDFLEQGNYTDGNNSVPDHHNESWIRAELGSRIEVDDRVEVVVGVAYQGVSGTNTPTAPAGTGANNDVTSNGPTNGLSGNAVVNDAYINLKEFLGYRALTIEAGRFPVSENLRKGHAAFLYDSEANNPTINAWDGIRAQYNYDSLDFSPYAFRMPDDSTLFGLMFDWEMPNSGNDRIFVTGSANLERNIVLNSNDGDSPASVDPVAPVIGSKLYTYYIGIDADLSDVELFGEFAMQRGTQNGDTSFDGFGGSGGIDWHLSTQIVAGLQLDYLSGDNSDNNAANNPNASNHSFINKWSGMSDTLIVENPKYGRLANLLEGNLEDAKVKLEYGIDEQKHVRLKLLLDDYRLDKAENGGDRDFGSEGDLVFSWDYSDNATINLMGGIFRPGSGYDAVSLGPVPGNSPIYLLAINLRARF